MAMPRTATARVQTRVVSKSGQLRADGHELSVVYVTGHWMDVDDRADLVKAREFP